MAVEEYVRKQMANLPSLSKKLTTRPDEEPFPLRPSTKYLLGMAQRFLDKDPRSQRFFILPGLRGVGKSTMLFQLARALFEKGLQPTQVLYMSCDNLVKLSGGTITLGVKAFEDILGRSLSQNNERIFILLDEAQYDPQWGVSAKVLFDENPEIFIAITGSSALALNMNPDVARRAHVMRVDPMGFGEYLGMKGHVLPTLSPLKELGAAASFDDAKSFFLSCEKRLREAMVAIPDMNYKLQGFLLSGGLPSSLSEDDLEIAWKKIYNSIERIAEADIPALGGLASSTDASILKMIILLADSPDRSIQKIAQELLIPPATAQKVLELLVRSELIQEVEAFGSVGKGLKKKKRHYFSTPSMMSAVLDNAGMDPKSRFGPLLECAVSNVLAKVPGASIKYDPDAGGADFVLESRSRAVLEVGWGDKGERQVRTSLARTRSVWGIVVSDEKKVKVTDRTIFVPSEMFLCLG